VDESLRRAEREGRGSPNRLRELLRSGELPEIRLRLAAKLGHLPAREALGINEVFVPFANPRDLVRALEPFGEQAWLRAAGILLSDQERILRSQSGQKRRAIAAMFADERQTIQAYLEDPSPETKERLERASGRYAQPGHARRIAKRHDVYGPSDAKSLNEELTSTLIEWALP